MKPYKILFLSIFIFLIIGCEKEFEFSNSENQKKLVVNFLIDNLREPDVFLTETGVVGASNNTLNPIDNAKVSFYKNGSFLSELYYKPTDTNNSFGSYNMHWFPSPDNEYSIVINHPTYGIVRANQYLRKLPNVTNWELYHYEPIANKVYCKFRIQFLDEPDIKNYYLLSVWHVTRRFKRTSNTDSVLIRYGTGSPPQIHSAIEDSIRDHDEAIAFSDAGFNGSLKELDFSFNDIDTNNTFSDTLLIEFRNISPDYYQYINSQNNQRISSAPVNVFSNIENGKGIIATSAIKQLFVTLKK